MMVHQEQLACQEGPNVGFAGKPSRLLKALHELAYASGFIVRRAARETKSVASRVKRPRLRILWKF
jgi:hypothetical protein